jgi:hypothetical protein
MKGENKEEKFTIEFIDAIKEIQALTNQSPKVGSLYIRMASNKDVSDDGINKLYNNIRTTFKDNSADSEKAINALKIIRSSCLNDESFVNYANKQAKEMVEIKATADFFAGRVQEENKKKKEGNGCIIS